MANEKVSQMTPLSAAELALDDVFLITDTSQKQSKKISAQDVLTYFEATGSFNAFHATTADTASFMSGVNVTGIVNSASHANISDSSSFSTRAVLAVSASYAASASVVSVLSATTSSYSFTSDTSSLSNTASFISLAQSSSFLVSTPGVNNGTSSYSLNSLTTSTASFALSINTASYANRSGTSDLSNTASFVSPYNIMPAGTVITFAASTVPNGWLECNGSQISRSVYSALFTAISTTYGSGDGSTTFNLPDLRGYFIRGWDNGRGVDSGRTFGTQQADALKDHTHNLPGYLMVAGSDFSTGGNNDRGGSVTGNVTLPNGGKTETRPLNIAMMYLIKY